MKNIVIFASGAGSNAIQICKYFQKHNQIKVSGVFCNNENAKIIEKLKEFDIPLVLFTRDDFYNSEVVSQKLKSLHTDCIILAGFLWLIPENLVVEYKDRIINIHPALLPKFGGKGMYGKKVHEAVILQKEKESGITIHIADSRYDEGKILFQATTEIVENDTPDSLAAKINMLELTHFAPTIEAYLLG